MFLFSFARCCTRCGSRIAETIAAILVAITRHGYVADHGDRQHDASRGGR